MRQTMYLTDIPLMYTFLMLAAPFGLWLLVKGRTHVLLAVSGALWLAFQIFPAAIQVPWPIVGNTTFNLAAWQLLFFCAMAIGFHRDELARKFGALPRVPYMVFMGVLLAWLIQANATYSSILTRLVPGLDTTPLTSELFLKSALGPGRLIASAILFQFAFFAVTILWKPIAAAFGWLLLPLGQSALYGYTLHVVIIGLFYEVLPYLPGNVTAMGTLNTALQLSVILAIWVMIQRRFLFAVVPR